METNIENNKINIEKENGALINKIGFELENDDSYKIYSEDIQRTSGEFDNTNKKPLYLEYKDINTGDIKKITLLDKYGQSFFDKLLIRGINIEDKIENAKIFYNIIKKAKWVLNLSLGTVNAKGTERDRRAGLYKIPFEGYKYKIVVSNWNGVEKVILRYQNGEEDYFKPNTPNTVKTLTDGFYIYMITSMYNNGSWQNSGSVTITLTLDL